MSGFRRHLDERTIALHAGGDLSRLRRWLANRHLARCPACRAALNEYAGLRGALGQARPVPQVDFGALGHKVRVAAAQSRPAPGAQTRWHWRAAAGVGAGVALAALATLLLVPNSNDSKSDPALAATPVPAAPAELGPLADADVQLTGAGSLRVQAFHAGSGTLTITDYYAP